MKFHQFALLLCITFHTAQARIGETYEECVARYGQPLRTADGQFVNSGNLLLKGAQAEWDFDGFRIRIGWLPPEGSNGPADILVISKKGTLTEEQIASILEANAQGYTWAADVPQSIKGKPLSEFIARTAMRPILAMWKRDDGATADAPSKVKVEIRSARLNQTNADIAAQKKAEREHIPPF